MYHFLSVFNVAGNSLSPLWRRIVVYPPDRESLQSIVGARYQNLMPIAEKLIGRFLLSILPLIWFLYSQWNFTFPSLQKLMKKLTLLFVPSFLVRQLKTQLHSVPQVDFHWGKHISKSFIVLNRLANYCFWMVIFLQRFAQVVWTGPGSALVWRSCNFSGGNILWSLLMLVPYSRFHLFKWAFCAFSSGRRYILCFLYVNSKSSDSKWNRG